MRRRQTAMGGSPHVCPHSRCGLLCHSTHSSSSNCRQFQLHNPWRKCLLYHHLPRQRSKGKSSFSSCLPLTASCPACLPWGTRVPGDPESLSPVFFQRNNHCSFSSVQEPSLVSLWPQWLLSLGEIPKGPTMSDTWLGLEALALDSGRDN